MHSVTHSCCFASDPFQKERGLHSSHAGPAHEEEVSSKMAAETQAGTYSTSISVLLLTLLQTCYTNIGADERRELVGEEEDHTYELLLTAQTKVPESQSSRSTCVCVPWSLCFHTFYSSCISRCKTRCSMLGNELPGGGLCSLSAFSTLIIHHFHFSPGRIGDVLTK